MLKNSGNKLTVHLGKNNMGYLRVVPRDLFNESKLLKCLGQMALAIHDGKLHKYSVEAEHTNETSGFKIDQNPDDGSIFCSNFRVYTQLGSEGKIQLSLFSRLNSKDAYPLVCESMDGELLEVFNDKGGFTKEFLTYLDVLNKFKG
jgi:hypothetical protein